MAAAAAAAPPPRRFSSFDRYEGQLGNPLSLAKYAYANGNPVSHVDPTGQFSLKELLIVTGIVAIAASILLPPVLGLFTAASRYKGSGNSYKRQWLRDTDDMYTTYPWMYWDFSWWLPKTPRQVIRSYRTQITSQFDVPPELLATVLLTELRHRNILDSGFDPILSDPSVGIAQIRPSTIMAHKARRPDLYPEVITDERVARQYLDDPEWAIELLKAEIQYHAWYKGIDLNEWNTGGEGVRRKMVIRFVSSKDNPDMDDTAFGSIWGIESYNIIRDEKLLD